MEGTKPDGTAQQPHRGGAKGVGWRRRLVALMAGTCVALVALEAALWILAAVFRPEADRISLAGRPGERTIVCIGDSNTYGVKLESAGSYPGHLQSLLDLAPDNPWRVVNLGYPGQNSAEVRARLAMNLEAYQPEIVICWIGVNNSWSPAMGHLWEMPDAEPEAGWLETVVQECRTLKLVRLIWTNATRGASGNPGVGKVPGLDGAERGAGLGEFYHVTQTELDTPYQPDEDELRGNLQLDLRRIQQICADHGAELVLADYPIRPQWVRERINRYIADYGRSNDVPMVPLMDLVYPMAEEAGYHGFMLIDHHATAVTNYEVARVVLNTLVAANLIEPRTEWSGSPSLGELLKTFEARLVESGPDGVVVDLLGPPGWMCSASVEPVAAAPAGGEGGGAAQLVGSITTNDLLQWSLTTARNDRSPSPGAEPRPGETPLSLQGRGRLEVALPTAAAGGAQASYAVSVLFRLPFGNGVRGFRTQPIVVRR